MEYSTDITGEMKKKGISVNDPVEVEKDGRRISGILMPKSQGSSNTLIIKLGNGYNTGVEFDKKTKIRKIGEKEKKPKAAKPEKYRPDAGKPTIAILTTGGTIASRIDYRTGAVTPLETAEDIVSAVPEIRDVANIRVRQVFQMASDDMRAYHWMELARKAADEIMSGVDGIIITHGTDTMHYTSAALSLMVQDSPVPILLVGSQRSSDRGSSDAAMNLLCAANFIAGSDFAGVAICMHASASDDHCFIHQGVHARKMHTSRRDAFRSIDVRPYARVAAGGAIEFLRSDYVKKDAARKPHVVDRYDERVALVKLHPGFDYKVLESYGNSGYRGIILEGTGLGHAPVTETDDATKGHAKLLETIRKLAAGGIVIGMTSQCAYGKVNMNVYSPARMLQEAGVVPVYSTPEAALVKLGWSLGHTKNSEDAKKLLLTNVAGELLDRVDIEAYE